MADLGEKPIQKAEAVAPERSSWDGRWMQLSPPGKAISAQVGMAPKTTGNIMFSGEPDCRRYG